MRLLPLLASLALAALTTACGSDKPRRQGDITYQLTPRQGLPGNYAVLTLDKGDVAQVEGFLRAVGNAPLSADDVFAPERGVRYDSLHLSRITLRDGTLIVGYVQGAVGTSPRLIDGIKLSPKGELIPIDTAAVNRVVKVTPGRQAFLGAATQREVKTPGGQGGVIVSDKNVIDTLAIGIHVYPDGSMFVGKMAGDLGTDLPDFLEGYYETPAGEVHYVPAERKLVDGLVDKALKAKQPTAHAARAFLLNLPEDLNALYGKVAANYDTPPMLNGVSALEVPLKVEPYEMGKGKGVSHPLTLRFLVNVDGTVSVAKVTDCTDETAANAATGLVRELIFTPARRGGKPVKAWIERKLTYMTSDFR